MVVSDDMALLVDDKAGAGPFLGRRSHKEIHGNYLGGDMDYGRADALIEVCDQLFFNINRSHILVR